MIRNIDREFAKQLLTITGIKFPVQEKGNAKIEEHNKININIFGHKDKIHTIFILQNKLWKVCQYITDIEYKKFTLCFNE